MAEILVRDIDPASVERLRERARRNQRSLEAEAKRILEDAAPPEASADPKKEFREWSAAFRERLRGRDHSDSADLIREDRDSDHGRE